MQAEVWIIPAEGKVLVTDLIGVVPSQLLSTCTTETAGVPTPRFGYPPGCHAGIFESWSAGLTTAQQKAQELGYQVIEESCLDVLLGDEPAGQLELAWLWEER